MKTQNSMLFAAARWTVWVVVLWGLLVPCLAGTWTQLTQGAPGAVNLMLLLPNGTVMASQNDDYTYGNNWYLLTPDGQGHYTDGQWTTLNPMNDTRLFFSSQVLPNGQVFVAGGEYGSGQSTAELFDIASGHWNDINPPTSLMNTNNSQPDVFKDADSILLDDGTVMIQPVSDLASHFGGLIFDPNGTSWSLGSQNLHQQGENSWLKLPDNSILTVDPIETGTNGVSYNGFGTNSERYIPGLQKWIKDANVPLSTFAALAGYYGETGPAFMLPNGDAFFLSGNGNNAIYTPSGNTNKGSWREGASTPQGLVSADAAAAMMPNGKILCAVAPLPYIGGGGVPQFPSPTSFFEYDYTDDSFTQVASPTGGLTDNLPTYLTAMLVLPDGTVLYSHMGSDLYIYQPDPPMLASGKPTVTSISVNTDGSYHLVGKGLNGISQGAAYGDDAQMDSNYPLVRIADSSGNVYYGNTYNWSSTGVQTGATLVTTEFTVPVSGGVYSLSVIANGIASDPVTFYGPVWVDFNFSGFLEFGTYYLPYSTLALGVSAVTSGGTIFIKPGQSSETFTITKPMNIDAVGGSVTIGE